MSTKKELLIKLTELSEQIRHSKKRREGKGHHEHKDSEHVHKDAAHVHKDGHHSTKQRLSFTAKRTICMLLDEESINQRSISKMLGVSAQTVSEMVKTLEAKELIIKSQGELNNENIISLTEKGREVAIDTNKRIADRAERVFTGLSEQEVETLGDILGKISENILSDID